MTLPWTTVVVLVAALLFWTAWAFNKLVRDRNLLREGWSGIDVQLRRRRDLIPNLVETVKGYGAHESRLLEKVTKLRRPDGAAAVGERLAQENSLTDQLKRLFAVVEAYPDLKANRNYLTLQKQLVEIEDQIQMARRYYNGAVRNYNTRTESFPSNLIARLFGFGPAEFFQVETATERSAPRVEA